MLAMLTTKKLVTRHPLIGMYQMLERHSKWKIYYFHFSCSLVQWNPDLTICQGRSKITSLYYIEESLYRNFRYSDMAVK